MPLNKWVRHPLLQYFFYGNFFYGVCIVAQSIEAGLQQRFSLNDPGYYGCIFLATVLYYNYPYARVRPTVTENPRTQWHLRHPRFLLWSQILITALVAAGGGFFIAGNFNNLFHQPRLNVVLAAIFPVVAGLYYGFNFFSVKYNLRGFGWLKPFVIGFAWAGAIVVYPVLMHNFGTGEVYHFTVMGCILFLKNMMFISVLCIMFDIKDFAVDSQQRLGTFVVLLGLRKTIFKVLLPLTLLGLLTFITFATNQHFSPQKIVINMIPFVSLLLAAVSLRKRRHLLYYLVVIDGLMLVKAACGIVAMIYF